jgi:hypothetical protein
MNVAKVFFGERNGIKSPYLEGKKAQFARFRPELLVCCQNISGFHTNSTLLSDL